MASIKSVSRSPVFERKAPRSFENESATAKRVKSCDVRVTYGFEFGPCFRAALSKSGRRILGEALALLLNSARKIVT